jgi:hypothetical protein
MNDSKRRNSQEDHRRPGSPPGCLLLMQWTAPPPALCLLSDWSALTEGRQERAEDLARFKGGRRATRNAVDVDARLRAP